MKSRVAFACLLGAACAGYGQDGSLASASSLQDDGGWSLAPAYRTAPVLCEHSFPVGQDGRFRRLKLLEIEDRYPTVLVDETIGPDSTGRVKILRQVGMVGDHLLLKMRPGVTALQVHTLAQRLGGRIRSALSAKDYYLFEIPQARILADLGRGVSPFAPFLSAFSTEAAVEIAEPDYLYSPCIIPNDTSYGSLWGMTNAEAPSAWDVTTGSSSVKVAVIDTGVNTAHPDLAPNLWVNPGEIAGNGIDDDANGFIDDINGWDFGSGDNNPMDGNGHGTHCAGTIGARGNNATGVTGVCWDVKIVCLKIANSSGSLLTSAAVQAVDYASKVGCRATSNSWGGGGFSTSLYNAISDANEDGVLFVAAAGNSAQNSDVTPMYPAGYDLPNIISVAAMTSSNALASFSNWGATRVDLGAPGSSILSTYTGSSYATMSGTSMAAPHVTGACALIWARFPTQSHSWVKQRLLDTVAPTTALAGKCVSGGRLKLSDAIRSEAPTITITAPASGAVLTAAPAAFAGTAASGNGLPISVAWANTTTGKSGVTGGSAEAWTASVPLAIGSNTVVVTATGSTGATRSASRTITYNPPPALATDPGSLTFDVAWDAATAVTQPITVSNAGGGTLSWSASSDKSWARALTSSGSLGLGASEAVNIEVDPASLASGNHTAKITLTAPGATDSPRVLNITVNKAAPPAPEPVPTGGGGGGGGGGGCGLLGVESLLLMGLLSLRRLVRRDPA